MKKNSHKTSHLVDEDAAIYEFLLLSRNAQLYLMDRIGNNLQSILLSNYRGDTGGVDKGVGLLIEDMKKIGLFEMHGRWGKRAEGQKVREKEKTT